MRLMNFKSYQYQLMRKAKFLARLQCKLALAQMNKIQKAFKERFKEIVDPSVNLVNKYRQILV